MVGNENGFSLAQAARPRQKLALAQDGLDWIDLELLSVNAPARRLYLATGFVQTGEQADMFRIDGEQHGYTFMSRPLRP